MKIRHSTSSGQDKVELQMTPMIDIVFQLLIFFLMSFKIASQEGDFNIKMPVAAITKVDDIDTTIPIKIRLKADADGKLVGIQMNDKPINSFKELHSQVLGIVGGASGPSSAADNTEVELDCDYGLKYKHVVEAITAVSGYIDESNNVVKLIQKIKFAPPKKPG